MHGSFSLRKKFKPKKGKRIFPTVKEVASEASDSQGKDEVDAKYVMSVDSNNLYRRSITPFRKERRFHNRDIMLPYSQSDILSGGVY